MVPLEQRHGVGVMLHLLGVARHQEFHKLLGRPVTLVALDKYLFDIFVVDIADRALDKVAVGVDQHRRCALEGVFADTVPQPR